MEQLYVNFAEKLTACSILIDSPKEGTEGQAEKGGKQPQESEGLNGGVTATLRLVKQATEEKMKNLIETAIAKVNEVRDGEGSSVGSLLQQVFFDFFVV